MCLDTEFPRAVGNVSPSDTFTCGNRKSGARRYDSLPVDEGDLQPPLRYDSIHESTAAIVRANTTGSQLTHPMGCRVNRMGWPKNTVRQHGLRITHTPWQPL